MESSVNQDLKVEADQIQLGTEIARTGENTWKMPKGYEYVDMSFSRKIRALLLHCPGRPKHRYRPTPPNYRPPSQAYSLTSPLSSRKSRSYKPTSLSDRPTSPEYNPTSLISIPTPPSYRPIPPYSLTSEDYPHIPRIFRSFTTEPGYCPGSLDYAHALTPNKFTQPCDIPTSPALPAYGLTLPTSASSSSCVSMQLVWYGPKLNTEKKKVLMSHQNSNVTGDSSG